MAGEVNAAHGHAGGPERPFVAILGGSKVSDKIKVIDALMDKCDTLVIGGGMCFTFLLAQGKAVGTSLKEEDWVERAAAMIAKAQERGVKLLLAGGRRVRRPLRRRCRNASRSRSMTIPGDMMGLDIGPRRRSSMPPPWPRPSTVFWNGPMGGVRDAVVRGRHEGRGRGRGGTTSRPTPSSAAATAWPPCNKFGLADRMTFISTGRRRLDGAGPRRSPPRRGGPSIERKTPWRENP